MDNIAFSFGNFTVTWYGILVACGFLAGFFTATRRAPRAGISQDQVSDVFTWIIIGGILGARFLYVVSYPETFSGGGFLDVFKIWKGGLVFFGGLIGGSVATVIYCRLHKLSVYRLGDVLAPSLSLGHGFGRIGCLMSGCCYGSACSLPWAIRFPNGHQTYPDPVHPVQIYESALNFALYGILAFLYRRRSFDGQVLGIYCMAYAGIRFLVEFFRGDYGEEKLLLGLFTQAHAISLFLLALGVWIWVSGRRSPLGSAASDQDTGRNRETGD